MDVPIEAESPCDLSCITKCLMLPSSVATQWLQLICWDHWRIVWTTLKWTYICIREEAWEHNEIIMLTSESILVNLLPSIMFYINWKLLVRFMMFKWCSMGPMWHVHNNLSIKFKMEGANSSRQELENRSHVRVLSKSMRFWAFLWLVKKSSLVRTIIP